MKKSLTALAAIGALTLAACGGVDRDGSRDLFIEQVKEATGLDADPDCVDGVLDQYSDDKLEEFDKVENQGTAEFETFSQELFECVDLESGDGG